MWDNEHRLTIVSEPQVLGVPLSSSTTTRIVLAISNNANGQVLCEMYCELSTVCCTCLFAPPPSAPLPHHAIIILHHPTQSGS